MMRYTFHERSDEREVGLVIATHSPYIINHLNVLLRASYSQIGRDAYHFVMPDKLAAYKVTDGGLMDLMATDDESGQLVINTLDLSEIMEDIYNDYEALALDE